MAISERKTPEVAHCGRGSRACEGRWRERKKKRHFVRFDDVAFTYFPPKAGLALVIVIEWLGGLRCRVGAWAAVCHRHLDCDFRPAKNFYSLQVLIDSLDKHVTVT